MILTFQLPWPPTANTYWRRNGNRYFISKRGVDYREAAYKECYAYRGIFLATDRLNVSIKAYPPDKRKRDLDNLFKSCLDSLQYAGMYFDDNQIDKLSIERMPTNDNKLTITLELIN